MSQDLQQPTALAANRIDINDPASMSAWSKELELPEERLREVIDMIGPMTAAIRFYVASPKFKVAQQDPTASAV